MSVLVTVNCPKCGAPVAVNCKYSGGSSSDTGTCGKCSRLVYVRYANDSFGFRIRDVR